MIANIECTPAMKKMPRLAHPALAAGVWVAGAVLSSYFLTDAALLSLPVRLALAPAPVPCFLFFVWAQVQWYRLADEMQQKIQLTAWVHAFVSCILGAMLLFYLQRAEVFPASRYPDLDYFGDVLPFAMAAGYITGLVRASRRYA